jgi:hypothetical protein
MTTAPEQIKAWADKVEASSFDFARHGSYSPEGKAFWEAFEPKLSYADNNAVVHELHRRMTVAAWAKAELPEAIKAIALDALAKDVRGVEHKPEPVDLSFLAERAKRTTNQFGTARKAYAPKGGWRAQAAAQEGRAVYPPPGGLQRRRTIPSAGCWRPRAGRPKGLPAQPERVRPLRRQPYRLGRFRVKLEREPNNFRPRASGRIILPL